MAIKIALTSVTHGTRRSDSLCWHRLIRDSVVLERAGMGRNAAETAVVYDGIWRNLTATSVPVIRVQTANRDFGGISCARGVDENVVLDPTCHVIIEFANPLRHFH